MTSPEELQAKLQTLWLEVLPLMRRRMEVVSRAAQALTAGALTADLNSEAIHEAHKLAGALGVFGLHQGSECARKIEQVLSSKVEAETQSASLHFSQDEIAAVRECVDILEHEIKNH